MRTVQAQALQEGDVILLPFERTATVMGAPVARRAYVYVSTEHGQTRYELTQEVQIAGEGPPRTAGVTLYRHPDGRVACIDHATIPLSPWMEISRIARARLAAAGEPQTCAACEAPRPAPDLAALTAVVRARGARAAEARQAWEIAASVLDDAERDLDLALAELSAALDDAIAAGGAS